MKIHSIFQRKTMGLAAAFLAASFLIFSGAAFSATTDEICSRTASFMLKTCTYEAYSDHWLKQANCLNSPGPVICGEASSAFIFSDEFRSAMEECRARFAAREEACDGLEPGPYNPAIDPDDFVERIDNPYFPLTPGTTFIYEKETDEGTERVEVQVTDQTKEILGVECTVVTDTVFLDGELIEFTWDWYAQDKEGNVWYFGELSFEFEDGELLGLEGSWQAGVDGAKPGIIIPADPAVGDVYRQEFALGEAEDMGEVLGLMEIAAVPYGSWANCLKTADFTPLEPDVLEHKYYAPGVGLVLEVDPEEDERVELVEIRRD